MNTLSGRLCVCALSFAAACAHAAPPGATTTLYLGYFQEDPAIDPHDPLTGTLYLRLDGDRFAGGLLYAMQGCRPGLDEARLFGERTADEAQPGAAPAGAELSGAWSGDFDGQPVGGGFNGLTAGAGYAGTYSGAAGSLAVDCDADGGAEYRVASLGRWWLWPLGGGSIALADGADGSLSWPPVAQSAHYGIRVFDADCLRRGGGARCLRVDDDHSGTVVDPRAWSAALTPRRQHLAVVLAVGAAGEVLGFGSRRFRLDEPLRDEQ